MTYNVFSGTLNLLTSLHLQLTRCIMLANRRHLHRHKYYDIIILTVRMSECEFRYRRLGDGTLQSDDADAEESNNNVRDVFDCTNTFHWCPAPDFHNVILVPLLTSLLLKFEDYSAVIEL